MHISSLCSGWQVEHSNDTDFDINDRVRCSLKKIMEKTYFGCIQH